MLVNGLASLGVPQNSLASMRDALSEESKMSYTIYHIPGLKVGCTVDFESRKAQYHEGIIIKIMVVIPDEMGPKYAGNVEWYFADLLGYKRWSHYADSNWGISITDEQRSEIGRMGGIKTASLGKSGFKNLTDEQRSEIGKMGAAKIHSLRIGGFYNLTKEQKSEYAKIGGKYGAFVKQVTCHHCGKTGHAAIMKRWHFDNCKKKPTIE